MAQAARVGERRLERGLRGALGLRWRIVGAVLVTTVLTLLVAALALLGPLEHNLRAGEFTSFKTQVGSSSTASFRRLGDLTLALQARVGAEAPTASPPTPSGQHSGRPRSSKLTGVSKVQAEGERERRLLLVAERELATRVGASDVALLGLAGVAGEEAEIIERWPPDGELTDLAPFDDAQRALQAVRMAPVYSTRSLDGTEYARAAVPFTTQLGPHQQPARWVLVVRKPFAEVADAVRTVRTAFLEAALAGLALTLVLAIPLAARIVRRLRRLREAALELSEGRVVAIPSDRARDEVGDLARTFALMQEQLRQQEEARRAFVATASHELRTPLTSLEGMLELLEDELGTPTPDLADARELLGRARAQSYRLAHLAADLLDLSRIDAQVKLRSEPVELRELSRAVLAEFHRGENDGEQPVGDAEPVWALGDPGSVARILRILIDNGLRVSPSGVTVRVAQAEGRAVLSVCDEGPGVPEEERVLIFERFQRGRTTSGQAGFGLGLAIGRELAGRMGGELVLEDLEGPGATFSLRLPRAAAPQHEPLPVG